MTPGKWAYSRDEERYHGEYDTPEEAFLAGNENEGMEGLDDDESISVGPIIPAPDPVLLLDAEWVIDQVAECLAGEAPDDEDSLPTPAPEQLAELSELLRAAYRTWLEKHPDQRPQWYLIDDRKVQTKSGAQIRALLMPEEDK